jgi:hypothetical protein
MFAHHEPSFHQTTLSARLVPVGATVPRNEGPATWSLARSGASPLNKAGEAPPARAPKDRAVASTAAASTVERRALRLLGARA